MRSTMKKLSSGKSLFYECLRVVHGTTHYRSVVVGLRHQILLFNSKHISHFQNMFRYSVCSLVCTHVIESNKIWPIDISSLINYTTLHDNSIGSLSVPETREISQPILDTPQSPRGLYTIRSISDSWIDDPPSDLASSHISSIREPPDSHRFALSSSSSPPNIFVPPRCIHIRVFSIPLSPVTTVIFVIPLCLVLPLT